MNIPIRPGGPGNSNSGAVNASAASRVAPVKSDEQVQERKFSVAAPSKTTAPTQTPELAKPRDTPVVPKPTVSRPVSPGDIADHLVSMGFPPTTRNTETVSALLKYGVEASKSLMEMVQSKVGDGSARSIEAAVVSLSKGLGADPKSIDLLSQFLRDPTSITSSIKAAQQATQQFIQILNRSTLMLDPGLFSALSALFPKYEKELAKMTGEAHTSRTLERLQVSRGALGDDTDAILRLVSGLEQQLSRTAGPRSELLGSLSEMKKQLSGLLGQLALQGILSKDPETAAMWLNDRYFYWQLPNPLGAGAIDILIKKDTKKKSGMNPSKTRLVVQFDTPDLGQIGVIVDVADTKIWYSFHSETSGTQQLILQHLVALKDRMEALNYQVISLNAYHRKVDLKKLLLPTLSLDRLHRVQTEV